MVPFIPDEKVIDVVSPIMDLGYFFGVIIWGSVKVFGKWEYFSLKKAHVLKFNLV